MHLTQPIVGNINVEKYDTSGLEIGKNGQFKTSRAYDFSPAGGRKTASIIEDVVYQSRDRKGDDFLQPRQSTLKECMASLPPSMSELLAKDTTWLKRDQIVRDFEHEEIQIPNLGQTMSWR